MKFIESNEYQIIYLIMSILLILVGLKLASIAIIDKTKTDPFTKIFYFSVGFAAIFLALNDNFYIHKKDDDEEDVLV